MRNPHQEVSFTVRWRPSLSVEKRLNINRKHYLEGQCILNIINGHTRYELGLTSMVLLKRPKADLRQASFVLDEEITIKAGNETQACVNVNCYVLKRNKMFIEIDFDALHTDSDREFCLRWIYQTLRAVEKQIAQWEK